MEKVMISCKRATELLSQQMDHELSFWQRFVLRFHLMICANCREFNKQLQGLRQFSSMFSERSSTNFEQNEEDHSTDKEKNDDSV